jgi:co-chaperonin GroES (HSP10)
MARSTAALKEVSASSVLTTPNIANFRYGSMEEAFPQVDPGFAPFGTVVLLQIRHPKRTTAGNIIIPDQVVSTEHYNTQVAKVVALGPVCFKATVTTTEGEAPIQHLVDWPEGAWFKVGDFVRVPRYGGDRFTAAYAIKATQRDPETGRDETVTVKDEVVFAIFKAKDILGLITGDPLAVKSYLD